MAAIIALVCTSIIYLLAKRLHDRFRTILLSPLLLCPLILVSGLLLTHIPYEQYEGGGQWLTLLLQPATVALAVPLYRNLERLRRYWACIVISIAGGVVVAIWSVVEFASWVGLDQTIVASLAPKSITTPIAMDVAALIGGTPAMTAVFVILTGLTGSALGPLLFRLLSIRQPIARGLLLGMGAHGTGTATAFKYGPVEGAFASLAMVLAAFLTMAVALGAGHLSPSILS